MSSLSTVLIIDKCEETARLYDSKLTQAGFSVTWTLNQEEFMDRARQDDFDVALVTRGLENELDFMIMLKVHCPFQKVLITSEYDFIRDEMIAEAMGFHTYLRKPFAADVLVEAVRKLAAKSEPKFEIFKEEVLNKAA